jgi:hypothetical protein
MPEKVQYRLEGGVEKVTNGKSHVIIAKNSTYLALLASF